MRVYNDPTLLYDRTSVLGHELIGRVEEVAENSTVTVGDRVVAEINLVCGKCHICKLAIHQS